MSFTALRTYLDAHAPGPWCPTHEHFHDCGGLMDTTDLDAVATPQEIEAAVLLALKERAAIGDKLAEGAVKVLERRIAQAGVGA